MNRNVPQDNGFTDLQELRYIDSLTRSEGYFDNGKTEGEYINAIKNNELYLSHIPPAKRTQKVCETAINTRNIRNGLKDVPFNLRTWQMCVNAFNINSFNIYDVPEKFIKYIAYETLQNKTSKSFNKIIKFNNLTEKDNIPPSLKITQKTYNKYNKYPNELKKNSLQLHSMNKQYSLYSTIKDDDKYIFTQPKMEKRMQNLIWTLKERKKIESSGIERYTELFSR